MTAPVVECVDASKNFGGVTAVDRVSFALEPGEILSILGTSGCGKTSVLRLIAGFEAPDEGEIWIEGRVASADHTLVPPEKRGVGMVFQEYALFPHMTVLQNIAFGLANISEQERHKRLSELLELVRLTGLERRYPHELSGGQQQRVALARTLAPKPVILLLDEPFSNVDATMRADLRREDNTILRESSITTIWAEAITARFKPGAACGRIKTAYPTTVNKATKKEKAVERDPVKEKMTKRCVPS